LSVIILAGDGVVPSCNVCLGNFIDYARLQMVISDSMSIDEGKWSCLESAEWKNKTPFHPGTEL
jgi:hypothetical protein